MYTVYVIIHVHDVFYILKFVAGTTQEYKSVSAHP